MEQTKPCRTCGQDKPLADFSEYASNGHVYRRKDCKTCLAAKERARLAGHPWPKRKRGRPRKPKPPQVPAVTGAAGRFPTVVTMIRNRAAERVLPDGSPFVPRPPYWVRA